MQTMTDLSLHFLQDVYDAEKRSVRSMQKMARAATDEKLKQTILQHRDMSEKQIGRLEQVFELVTGKRPRGKTCAAMAGLVKEVEEAIAESDKGPVLDAALIACAQAIEHYEIARYGAMAAWARQAGKNDVAALLQQTLDEEKQADQNLSALAESTINPAVSEADGEHDAEPQVEPPAPRRRGPVPGARKKAQALAAPEPEPAPAPAPAPARGRRKAAAAPEPAAPEPAAPAPAAKTRRTARK